MFFEISLSLEWASYIDQKTTSSLGQNALSHPSQGYIYKGRFLFYTVPK